MLFTLFYLFLLLWSCDQGRNNTNKTKNNMNTIQDVHIILSSFIVTPAMYLSNKKVCKVVAIEVFLLLFSLCLLLWSGGQGRNNGRKKIIWTQSKLFTIFFCYGNSCYVSNNRNSLHGSNNRSFFWMLLTLLSLSLLLSPHVTIIWSIAEVGITVGPQKINMSTS